MKTGCTIKKFNVNSELNGIDTFYKQNSECL